MVDRTRTAVAHEQLYERRMDSRVRVLVDDGSVEVVSAEVGPGFWARIRAELRGRGVTPDGIPCSCEWRGRAPCDCLDSSPSQALAASRQEGPDDV